MEFLHPAMWHNHDIDFARWKHPAVWQVALGWWISAILDFRGPIMGSLKSPCTTSYRSSTETIALNCLVF